MTEGGVLPFRTKLWFGVGQVAEGVKSRAFETFLFFYYEQVLGLSAGLSAAALTLAVLWDAISDPMMGSLSDATRTRWGRRHPYMYGAALPLALCFYLLFRPPADLGQAGLFLWLTAFSILARTALTAYSIPHFALGAELSSSYHERTSVVAFRSWFQQLAAWSVVPVSFATFFRATDAFPNGQLDPGAYSGFGLGVAILMAGAIAASAWGTHDRIASLPQAVGSQDGLRPRVVARRLRSALRSPSFIAYVVAILLFAVSSGLQRVLDLYMRTYFWGLSPDEIFLVGLAELAAVLVGIPFFARLSLRIDKKRTFVVGMLTWGGLAGLPPLLALLGLFPALGSPWLVPLLAAAGALSAFGSCGNLAVGGSLMADLVDEHELETGERSAGIFFGVINFASKFTPVAGISLASWTLAAIGLERGVDPSALPGAGLATLGLVFGLVVLGCCVLCSWVMWRYRLDRASVAEIQRELARRTTPSVPSPASAP